MSIDPVEKEARRREALNADIKLADALRALANHPEVVRWLAAQEKNFTEEILDAKTDIERVEAVARVKAIRDLRSHMTAIEAVSDRARRRMQELTKVDHNG